MMQNDASRVGPPAIATYQNEVTHHRRLRTGCTTTQDASRTNKSVRHENLSFKAQAYANIDAMCVCVKTFAFVVSRRRRWSSLCNAS